MPRAIVRTRASWSDAWQERPDLFCESISWELYGIGSASLVWNYGQIVRSGSDTVEPVPKLEILNHWVSIEYMPENGDGPDFWYGIVTSVAQDTHGGMQGAVSGDQRFIAHTPEILFTRVQITSSYARTTAGSITQVPYGITFNEVFTRASTASGQQIIGNRRFSPDEDLFTLSESNATPWTLENIVNYLTAYVDVSFPTAGPAVLGDPYFPMSTYTPANVVTHGRTVYDILNEVIDRRRGIAWTVRPLTYAADPIGFYVEVFSLSPVDVELPGLDDLQANTDTLEIEIYDAQDIDRCVVTSDALTQYQQVIVEGGNVGTVFTIPVLWPGLTSNVGGETFGQEYQEAASNLPGYNDKDLAEQKALNDKLRMSDRLRDGVSRYRISDNYLSYLFVGFSPENDNLSAAGSYLTYAGEVREDEVLYPSSIKLESYLPMTDANGAAIRPLIFDVKTSTGASARTNPFDRTHTYRDLSNAGITASENEAERKNGTPVSVAVEVADNGPVFGVLADNVQHSIWGYTRDDPWPYAVSETSASFADTRDMLVTLYARSPKRVRVSYPTTPTTENNWDQTQKLLIRAGDDYRLDAIKPYTILGPYTDGTYPGPDFTTDIVPLRDDRPTMRTIARLAWEWYRKQRKALSIAWRQVLPYDTIRVGVLITSLVTAVPNATEPANLQTLDGATLEAIGGEAFTLLQETIAQSVGDGIPFTTIDGGVITLLHDPDEPLEWITEPINTIISSVSINFATGTTSLDTQFSEIDFELVGGR